MSHVPKEPRRPAVAGVAWAPQLPSSATKEELLSAYRQWVASGDGGLFSDDDDQQPLSSKGPTKNVSKSSRKSVGGSKKAVRHGLSINLNLMRGLLVCIEILAKHDLALEP